MSKEITCSVCNGTGESDKVVVLESSQSVIIAKDTCRICGGSGKLQL